MIYAIDGLFSQQKTFFSENIRIHICMWANSLCGVVFSLVFSAGGFTCLCVCPCSYMHGFTCFGQVTCFYLINNQ